MNLISTESRFNGLHSWSRQCMPISTVLSMVSCQNWQKCCDILKKMHYMSSRSFKVIKFSTNRTCIYDFLLVTSSNFGCSSHFPSHSDVKVANRLQTHPVSLKAIASSDLLWICCIFLRAMATYQSKSRLWHLPMCHLTPSLRVISCKYVDDSKN